MAKQKITVAKIAERCGVSIATVSRVLSGSANVSPSLRKKIMDDIEDSGWTSGRVDKRLEPTEHKRAVIVCSMRLVGMPENDLAMILDVLYDAGYIPYVMFGKRSESFRECLNDRPDLVIAWGINDLVQNSIGLLTVAGIRVIGIGDAFRVVCPTICHDHVLAGRRAAEKLRASGVKKIGFFGGFGDQPHPESFEKISFRRIRDLVRGIMDVYPDFDVSKHAVSDSFGNLSALSDMLSENICDGWIVSEAVHVSDFLRARNNDLKDLPPIAALLYSTDPVAPVFRFGLSTDGEHFRKTLENLVSDAENTAPLEYKIPYKFINGEKI